MTILNPPHLQGVVSLTLHISRYGIIYTSHLQSMVSLTLHIYKVLYSSDLFLRHLGDNYLTVKNDLFSWKGGTSPLAENSVKMIN